MEPSEFAIWLPDDFGQHPQILVAAVIVDPVELDSIRQCKLTVRWFTTGKGDEDHHEHFSITAKPQTEQWFDDRGRWPWSCPRPITPLSYHGVNLRIHWEVVAELKRSVAPKSLKISRGFRLGQVARQTSQGTVLDRLAEAWKVGTTTPRPADET